jgi:hypothetical protein
MIPYSEDLYVPTTALGDWYAHAVVLQKRQVLLVVNQSSLLCVLVYLKGLSDVVPVFQQALTELLRNLGANEVAIRRERQEMEQSVIGRTKSKSVLGSLNDFVYQMHAAAEFNPDWTLLDHELALSQIPCAPIGYSNPAEKALLLLAQK